MVHTHSVNAFHVRLFAGALTASCCAATAAASLSSQPEASAPRSPGSRPELIQRTAAQREGEAHYNAEASEGLSSTLQAVPPTASQNMAYLLQTLDRFKAFAVGSRKGVEERHDAETKRLEAAINKTSDTGVMLALNQSITSNEQSLLETNRVYDNMVKFADSMGQLLQATTNAGGSCEATTCGVYASCTDTTNGPQCVCNEGYVGNGKDCHAPPEFMPHRLLTEPAATVQTMAADVDVAVFGANTLAIVFRDRSRGDIGRACVGTVREAGSVDLAPPEQFSPPNTKAFSPVVAGTDSRRIAIFWRDQTTHGSCWARGAALGVSGVRGAEMSPTWGAAQQFCRSQAHKMATVPMPNDRVVVLYADQSGSTTFGNSMLMDLGGLGELTSVGNRRFSEVPVVRLEATKLTPQTFIVAARAGQAVDDLDPTKTTNQEAVAFLGEVADGDLTFDPTPSNMDPVNTQLWGRGVSLIAPNTFAYSYLRGMDLNMMQAVVEVNSTDHRMKVVSGPHVVHNGFSPYVSMLSVPYSWTDPHTLTYFQDGSSSKIKVCTWDVPQRALKQCQDFTWLSVPVTSVAGVHLGGGKSFMVFAAESGVPYYGVFGLSKN